MNTNDGNGERVDQWFNNLPHYRAIGGSKVCDKCHTVCVYDNSEHCSNERPGAFDWWKNYHFTGVCVKEREAGEPKGANTALQNAVTAVSDTLDIISRVRGYVQIDNVYRELQEFLQTLSDQRMRLAAAEPTASEPKICVICGYLFSSVDERNIHRKYCPPAKPELSLFVIDWGDSCVVKVENGEDPMLQFENLLYQGAGRPHCYPRTFEQVRAAIDRLEGEPVFPYIEYHDKEYFLWHSREVFVQMLAKTYDALAELAGKPLPVYKKRKGKWERLHPQPDGFSADLPVSIWRYTLMEAE